MSQPVQTHPLTGKNRIVTWMSAADAQGHFNKPKLPQPPGPPDEETLIERVKKSMEIDKQRGSWKRRIKDIQYMSCVIISYFSESTLRIPDQEVVKIYGDKVY